MAKNKTVFVCKECGHEEARWLGRCPECGNWNSFHEIQKAGKMSKQQRDKSGVHNSRNTQSEPMNIHSIRQPEQIRINSGIEELNGVLGGGVMLGASVLIGGEPGIGKSTLMLQVAAFIDVDGPVLYVSGEESVQQIRMRSERLGITAGQLTIGVSENGTAVSARVSDKIGSENKKYGPGRISNLHVLCESNVDRITAILDTLHPSVVIIDSIQTLISEEAGNIPGTVNQLKYGCYELIDWARERNAALFLVAHVTKEGTIAGPKVIEHMVDTVLYFEQADTGVRIVRSVKNRHGSVDEIGLFTMESNGLLEVKNPVSFFLQQRKSELPPGITAAPVYEGSRVLMVEIQALVVPSKSGFSRIYSDKIDNNRVSRISAVLEKHLSVRFADQDIYVNVAGGMRLNEVGIELPLAMVLYSARTGIAVPSDCALAGEVSLAGEIRPTAHMQRRLRTVVEMGFKKFVGPGGVQGQSYKLKGGIVDNDTFHIVGTIGEAVKFVFTGNSGKQER